MAMFRGGCSGTVAPMEPETVPGVATVPLPPAPTSGQSIPALGDQFDPFHAHVQDPYPFYARVRVEEPVFYSAPLDKWVASRYADIVAVLLDPQTFSSQDFLLRPLPTDAPEVAAVRPPAREETRLINMDPPKHTRVRKITSQAFRPGDIAAWEPMIREVADQLIDAMGVGPADLMREFAYPLPLTVILRVLGVPVADLEACRLWCEDINAVELSSDLPVAERVAALSRVQDFNDYLANLVADRTARPRDDLVSYLASARVPGYEALKPQETVDISLTLILAGHDTTANLIGNAVLQLLRHPDQLALLRRDAAHIPAAVEECLRYDTPVLGFVRTATRDARVGGVPIPAGGKVLLLYGSGNHDEQLVPDAGRLDITRAQEAHHLGFGRGVHYCLGAPLARLELRIAIERLLTRLPGLRLLDPHTPPRRRPNPVVTGAIRLPLAWDLPPDRGRHS